MMVRLTLLFVAAILADAQALPPLAALLEQALSATEENDALAPEFTFDLWTSGQNYDKKGRAAKLDESTGETYFSSLRNLDIPLVVNGKARSAKDVEKARNNAYKQLEADARARSRREKKAKDSIHEGSQFNNVRMEAHFIFKNCPLSNLRVVSIQGRPNYAIDFASCSVPAAYKDTFRHLTSVRGTYWIDQATLNIVRCESWVAATGARWYEEEKQLFPGAEPVWLPRRVAWTFSVDPQLFGLRLDYVWQVTNPKRFVVTLNETVTEPNLVK